MMAPFSCTAFTTLRHASTCSSLQIPGECGYLRDHHHHIANNIVQLYSAVRGKMIRQSIGMIQQ
jgi:hypothetical protein